MPRESRRLARHALVLLLLPRPALVVARVETVQRILDRLVASRKLTPAVGEGGHAVAEQTARIVSAAARHLRPRPNCLHRSLVIRSLLAARGVPSSIRFGVRRVDGRFEAHAWVEHDGRPLTEPGELHRSYEPLRPAGESTVTSWQ